MEKVEFPFVRKRLVHKRHFLQRQVEACVIFNLKGFKLSLLFDVHKLDC